MRTGLDGIEMSVYQAFFLGMMVAWTPALLFLAWAVCEIDGPEDRVLEK
jgi:hypothetical protein